MIDPDARDIAGILAHYYHQGTWWKNAQGELIEITKMSPEYRYNCVRLLERNAQAIADRWVITQLAFAAGPMGPSGDGACDAFETMIDGVEHDPLAFIRGCDLYGALSRGLPTNPFLLWHLSQRARHWDFCVRRHHNSGPCTCEPKA